MGFMDIFQQKGYLKDHRGTHEDRYADFGNYRVYDSEVTKEVNKRIRSRYKLHDKIPIGEVVSEALEAFAYLSSEKDPDRINKKLHGK